MQVISDVDTFNGLLVNIQCFIQLKPNIYIVFPAYFRLTLFLITTTGAKAPCILNLNIIFHDKTHTFKEVTSVPPL